MERSIHDAVHSGDIQQVREAISRNPLCVKELDKFFYSPLHRIYDHIDPNDGNHQVDDILPIMQILIDHGADVNIKDMEDRPPLCYAIEKHQMNGVKMLLENKADPNIRSCSNITLLMEAVIQGSNNNRDNKIIKLLLNYKADPNLTNPYGETALDLAIYLQKLDYVQLLLESGARVKNIYRTFIKTLGTVNMLELPDDQFPIIIDFLLKHKNQIIERGHFMISNLGNYYKSPKNFFEYEHIYTLLRSLHRQNIDINFSSSTGDSDLHEAVREGNKSLVRDLLRNKIINVNATNYFRNTPLHIISIIKDNTYFEEIGRLLLHAGANWRAPNLIDETPFYLAVKYKQHTLIGLIFTKIVGIDNLASTCNFTNLPTLEICYTENDVALHELLVAICVDCEPVVDHLLDKHYDIDEASKHSRRDITIALVKAIELNKYKILKKLLEAGFKTDGRFSGDLKVLDFLEEDVIEILCLLQEFNDRSALTKLMYNSVNNYQFSDSRAPNLINLLLSYFIIEGYDEESIPDSILLRSLTWRNILMPIINTCKNDMYEMKNRKLGDVFVFDIMTMKLDALIKLINNKDLFDACTEEVQRLKNLSQLKYYDIALKLRLELALEKNETINAAFSYASDISENFLTRTNLASIPHGVLSNILSNLNMRDLKKIVENKQ